MEATPRVPMLVLTGFLGAGKTTALNRVLAALRPGGRRIALLVNDLGRVNVDAALLAARGSDLIELSGGCVCCKVDLQDDLWRGIHDLVRRARPDHVVLETTGIAEPVALLDGLAQQDGLAAAGVVCVIDAEVGARVLASRDEARGQVQVADRVLLTKLDLASAEQALATRAAVRELGGAHGELASFPAGPQGDFELAQWMLETRAPGTRARPPVRRHGHGQLVAFSFACEQPLVEPALADVLGGVGPALLRAKGFVRLAGRGRVLVQRAGERTVFTDAPGETAAHGSELVLIGDGLDESALRRALWACTARG